MNKLDTKIINMVDGGVNNLKLQNKVDGHYRVLATIKGIHNNEEVTKYRAIYIIEASRSSIRALIFDALYRLLMDNELDKIVSVAIVDTDNWGVNHGKRL